MKIPDIERILEPLDLPVNTRELLCVCGSGVHPDKDAIVRSAIGAIMIKLVETGHTLPPLALPYTPDMLLLFLADLLAHYKQMGWVA